MTNTPRTIFVDHDTLYINYFTGFQTESNEQYIHVETLIKELEGLKTRIAEWSEYRKGFAVGHCAALDAAIQKVREHEKYF